MFDDYDAGRLVSVRQHQVSDLLGLAALLDRASHDPRAFVLRGELLPDVDPRRCRRLLYAHREEDGTTTPPTFRDVPRRWAILDFDNVAGPYRFDPRDGELAAIYCRSHLPQPWRRCSYWWGLSSSAGFKPGLRIKLGFRLSRAVMGRSLERHLKACPIDPSTLRAVQPIYLARPILVGVADPIMQRTGLERDCDEQVELPDLPAEESRPASAAYDPDGRRFVSGQTEAAANKRLAALCDAIRNAPVGGRHRCLIWAAARAVELDDAIQRSAIAAELVAAAQDAGLEDSEHDLARQVKNGFRIGVFGSDAA